MKSPAFEVTEQSNPFITVHAVRSIVGKYMKAQHGGRMGPIAIHPDAGVLEREDPSPGGYVFATRDPEGRPVKGYFSADLLHSDKRGLTRIIKEAL